MLSEKKKMKASIKMACWLRDLLGHSFQVVWILHGHVIFICIWGCPQLAQAPNKNRKTLKTRQVLKQVHQCCQSSYNKNSGLLKTPSKSRQIFTLEVEGVRERHLLYNTLSHILMMFWWAIKLVGESPKLFHLKNINNTNIRCTHLGHMQVFDVYQIQEENSSWLAKLIRSQCHANEIKVTKPQFVTNFQRAYMESS